MEKVNKNKMFFFEKKNQKTSAPLRAVLKPSGTCPNTVMPAKAGIHDFS